MSSSPPNSRTNLDKAIQRMAGSPARFVEIRSLLAARLSGSFCRKASPRAAGPCNFASEVQERGPRTTSTRCPPGENVKKSFGGCRAAGLVELRLGQCWRGF